MFSHRNGECPRFVARFNRGIPSDFALIAGDAIHNLRTALDHATWELVGIDGGVQDRNLAFPAGRTRSDYESACNGIETPRDDTKRFLLSLAAYPGGLGQHLYGLRALDNLDKHQILTPIIGATRIGRFEIVHPDGKKIVTMENCSFSVNEDGRARMAGSRPGYTIRFDQNEKISFDMFFGRVDFFRMVPLIDTLVELRITYQMLWINSMSWFEDAHGVSWPCAVPFKRASNGTNTCSPLQRCPLNQRPAYRAWQAYFIVRAAQRLGGWRG